MKGKLLPTIEEEMKKYGHGHVYPRFPLADAEVDKEIVKIGASPKGIFVVYKGRTVLFDMKKLIENAVKIIDKVKSKNGQS